jgi:hypothetical protein
VVDLANNYRAVGVEVRQEMVNLGVSLLVPNDHPGIQKDLSVSSGWWNRGVRIIPLAGLTV